MNTRSRSLPSSLFPLPSDQGFTLIELLVVIGIIGILSGVLLSTFGGASESARLAKCQSNIKNLATAVYSYAMESGHYPYAGSAQYMYSSIDGDLLIGVHRAWLSWLDRGQFVGRVEEEKNITQSSYAGSDDDVTYALTHGVIWGAVGRNRSVYQCPVHVKACQKRGFTPGWSYVMNPYFGYERQKGKAMATKNETVKINEINRADRRLLFAEVHSLAIANLAKYNATSLPESHISDGSGSITTDGVLQYRSERSGKTIGGDGSAETIGFNHIRGNHIVGLVAFADGHTETITLPKSGSLEQLTGWLCDGYDVTFDGTKYSKINDSDVN